jgi:DNA-binding MarR family transcriptional regulator
MRSSPQPQLTDLPFLLVALALGFQALLKRLRSRSGLREDAAFGMGSIFFALCENEGCIMKDLGTRLRMPKGTLSGLIGRMEQVGLVERWQCPDDGRAQRVRLTRKARAMAPELRSRHAQVIEILQSGLNPAEVADLKRLLGRVLENLRGDESTEKSKPVQTSTPSRSGRAAAAAS